MAGKEEGRKTKGRWEYKIFTKTAQETRRGRQQATTATSQGSGTWPEARTWRKHAASAVVPVSEAQSGQSHLRRALFSQGLRWTQHSPLSTCQLFWRTALISVQNLLGEELETIFSNCLFPVRATLPSSSEMKWLRSQTEMLSMSEGSAWPQVPHRT